MSENQDESSYLIGSFYISECFTVFGQKGYYMNMAIVHLAMVYCCYAQIKKLKFRRCAVKSY